MLPLSIDYDCVYKHAEGKQSAINKQFDQRKQKILMKIEKYHKVLMPVLVEDDKYSCVSSY